MNRDFEVTKTMNVKSVKIVMCEILTESEPSDQDMIWTIDPTSLWSFVDQDFEVTKTLNVKSVEIAMCEISNEYELSYQDVIWTIDPTHVSIPCQLGTRGITR
jgi:hypothetical protein